MFPEKSIPEEHLPESEERQRILEQARRVLDEACFVTGELDRMQAELSVIQPSQNFGRPQTDET
jgi:hypothetical protein